MTAPSSPADLELATFNRRGTRHLCPDDEYEMFAIDRYRDACRHCGQILPNELRAAKALALVFGGVVTTEMRRRADRT